MSGAGVATLPLVECGYCTDPGRDPEKQVNEDNGRHAPTSRGYLAVVCDGMGGHEGGQEASRVAVQTIFEFVENAPSSVSHRQALIEAIEAANRNVYALAKPHVRARPGSTVVAVLIHADGAEVAHVGDSRVYLFHAGEVQRLTSDHSAVQMMVDAGAITPEQAKVHPDANVITRALGMAPDVEVEARVEPFPYVPDDVFLLCSDGLCDLVGEFDIPPAISMAPTLSAAAAELTELANSRGGYDNITVLLVRTRQSSRSARDVRPTVLDNVPPATLPSAGASAPPDYDGPTLVTEPLKPPPVQPTAAPSTQTQLMEPLSRPQPGPARATPATPAAPQKPAAIPAAPPRPAAPAPAGRPSWVLPLVLAVGLLAIVIAAGILVVVIREERGGHKTPALVPTDTASAASSSAPPEATAPPTASASAPPPK